MRQRYRQWSPASTVCARDTAKATRLSSGIGISLPATFCSATGVSFSLSVRAAVGRTVFHYSLPKSNAGDCEDRFARPSDIGAGIGRFSHRKRQHRRLEGGVHKEGHGAILRPPSSFLVQTNTSGSGEVRAVACPMLISFIAKIFLSCNMQTAFRQIRIDFCRYIYYTKNKFRVKYAEISYTV